MGGLKESAKRIGDKLIENFSQGATEVAIKISEDDFNEGVFHVFLAKYLAEAGATFKVNDLDIFVKFGKEEDEYADVPATVKMKTI